MRVFAVSIFFLLLLALFAVIAVVVAVYLLYYRRTINHRLTHPGGHRLPSPAAVAVFTALAVLLVFFLIRIRNSSPDHMEEYWNHTYDYLQITDEAYASMYSIEENAGYTKQTQTVSDVEYTLFISTDAYDRFHPQFILYVKPLKGEHLTYQEFGSFYTDTGEEIYGLGTGGATVDAGDSICFIGSTTTSCNFALDIGFWDENDFQTYLSKEDSEGMEGALYTSHFSFPLENME